MTHASKAALSHWVDEPCLPDADMQTACGQGNTHFGYKAADATLEEVGIRPFCRSTDIDCQDCYALVLMCKGRK